MLSSALFRTGQILKGRAGAYTITKQVQETVWFVKTHRAQETVVIKSVQGHPRVENERDVLKRLQHRTPFLRPLVDEIEDLSTTTIALKYLQSDLLKETVRQTLNREELKHVCRSILEALKVIHEQGLVHTDVKLDNVFVNLQEDIDRFSEVQLGDLGGCYSVTSDWATSGTLVGTPMWSSPEVLMEMPWNTAADIWSFGTLLISLIYGGDFHLFRPNVDRDHEEYILGVVMEQLRCFGPFPEKIHDIASPETFQSIIWLSQQLPAEKRTPFDLVTEREVMKKDKDFIGKIMKLDWRDRPTAKELLEDKWWHDE
ncbi:kinase-like protein [Cucurbitaria berberidis CBS 394.84]|uniref:Kinase-like protein n=1 Tax=Cucurbitaria berberidis CBS 394.84 TaxID=1168544 RepID=A0A9P4GFT8_9PLEO|nr:kinase-like protein [Cucurbitaria berberidis CBS 394.84]KAF1844390.1 kinase-like protein [Cucurbitaria berberidis CBS 394.84]